MNPLNTLVTAVAFVIGVATGALFQMYDSERVAVRNGAGQYNARTGNFEWIVRDDPKTERDYVTEVHNQMIMNRLNNQKCE